MNLCSLDFLYDSTPYRISVSFVLFSFRIHPAQRRHIILWQKLFCSLTPNTARTDKDCFGKENVCMESEREKLILDGNAFYEIDLDCQKEKERRKQKTDAYDNRKNREQKYQK